jgi:hypothetical protein
MTIKASGRAALVLAAGLWICAAVPSQAADDADSAATPVVKHSLQHPKNYADDKSSKKAEKPSGSNKTADAVHSSDGSALHSSRLPPSVANANAELTTETRASKDAKAMSERANNIVQAAADNTAAAQPGPGSTVVASDQLNDVDRALAAPAAQPEAAVPVEAQQAPPATSAPPVIIAASSGNSTWDQTSLIGKVFIGFGALLTLASAARMFIA